MIKYFQKFFDLVHREEVFAAQAAASSWRIKPVETSAHQWLPSGEVRLLDGLFKTMQDMDIAYLMRLKPGRLLARFGRERGKICRCRCAQIIVRPGMNAKRSARLFVQIGPGKSPVSLGFERVSYD